jgi:hypothetical protein
MYKPRRPQASPFFRLVQDHFRALRTVYDEQFAPTYGPWRPVVREVAEKFLACGILDHGFSPWPELNEVSRRATGRRLGLPESAIAKVERGQRQLSFLEALDLADLYGLSPLELDPRRGGVTPERKEPERAG